MSSEMEAIEKAKQLIQLRCSTMTIRTETGLSFDEIYQIRESLNEENRTLLNE